MPRTRGGESRVEGARALRVEGGRVACPQRGLVDLTVCWMCPASIGLSGDVHERLLCTADPFTTVADESPTTPPAR